MIYLLKNCKQIKVSQKAILSSMSLLCKACQLGKIHKQHFPTTETKTTKVFNWYTLIFGNPHQLFPEMDSNIISVLLMIIADALGSFH